jgi:hypothetical protein
MEHPFEGLILKRRNCTNRAMLKLLDSDPRPAYWPVDCVTFSLSTAVAETAPLLIWVLLSTTVFQEPLTWILTRLPIAEALAALVEAAPLWK